MIITSNCDQTIDGKDGDTSEDQQVGGLTQQDVGILYQSPGISREQLLSARDATGEENPSLPLTLCNIYQ